jgi:energy-coupling factor transporter ATP-binding protein EcfA2
MLEQLMKLYVMAMAFDVRSPMPHLVGPPGCGKSTTVEMLAELLGVELHIINVSRLSPLEVEGVQMPHGSGEEMVLKMLPATFWTSLKDGDILLMDEFLRGFPEVYSGLLDIFTSRRVGAFRLPKVFIIGASNSVIAYDAALEDRLLHIPVPDPRRSTQEKQRLARLLIDEIGLNPTVLGSQEMDELLMAEVLPLYNLLDSFKKNGRKVGTLLEGTSLRNLIGQAQLRMVQSNQLKALIDLSNHTSMTEKKPQFVVLLDGKPPAVPKDYHAKALALVDNAKLTELQRLNTRMNLQLIEMEAAVHEEDVP